MPATKECCPVGHKFIRTALSELNYKCDRCDVRISTRGGILYDDPLCNFGVCQLCHSELPEKLNGSPRGICNEPEYCDKGTFDSPERLGHLLVPSLTGTQKNLCFHCRK